MIFSNNTLLTPISSLTYSSIWAQLWLILISSPFTFLVFIYDSTVLNYYLFPLLTIWNYLDANISLPLYALKINLILDLTSLTANNLRSQTIDWPLLELGGNCPEVITFKHSMILVFPVPFLPYIRVIGFMNRMYSISWGLYDLIPLIDIFTSSDIYYYYYPLHHQI